MKVFKVEFEVKTVNQRFDPTSVRKRVSIEEIFSCYIIETAVAFIRFQLAQEEESDYINDSMCGGCSECRELWNTCTEYIIVDDDNNIYSLEYEAINLKEDPTPIEFVPKKIEGTLKELYPTEYTM